MLNVQDYVNSNGCLFSVSTERPKDKLIRHPYLEETGYFSVRLDGREIKKTALSFEDFVKLLAAGSGYPSASVRCKPNRPGISSDAGGIVIKKLDWEPLRLKLIEDGFGSLVGETPSIAATPAMGETISTISPQEVVEPPMAPYVVDPSRNDERKRVLREQTTRPGQQRFRQSIIDLHGEAVCGISGCRVVEVVQAAHIMPYLGDEDNHVANGLLLRADLHILFDRDLLGIDPITLKVHLAPTVQRDPGYAGLHGITLALAYEVSRPALQERWNWYRQQLDN